MKTAQLEMSFESHTCPRRAHRRSRQTGAQWWFARMRQVVDKAIDWNCAPQGRPEQTWLPGTRREIALAAAAPAYGARGERQVCE